MLGLLNDLKRYKPKNAKKIKSKEEVLTSAEKLDYNRIMSLRHLKIQFFCLKMDFKKNSQACLINHYQIG